MSQDANATPPGGQKSTLMVAIPIMAFMGAFMGVIFGVTLASQYTGCQKRTESEKDKPGTSVGNPNEPPLVFHNSTRSWDPPSLAPEWRDMPLIAPSRDPDKTLLPFSYSAQDRIFQFFYESGPQERRTAFWFENRNPKPVTLQLKGLGCSACSGARLASIPPEVTRAYLQRSALAALPIGAFNPFGVGLADPAADFAHLDWTAYKFSEDRNATYKVRAGPEAPDKWTAQWGILEFTFTVNTSPKIPLWTEFATQVDGTEQIGGHRFEIYFAPSEAFALSQTTLDIGEINPLTPDREYTFLVYSATRGPGSEFNDLDTPACVVQAPPGIDVGKFVEVTKVDRLPNSELLGVAESATKQGKFMKVLSAYRVTVAVRPKVGDARLDIGLMERTVFLTVGGVKPQAVQVTAMVKGSVWLASGKTDVELSFKGKEGLTRYPVELVTEAAGTELAVVEAECLPRFVKYELVKQPDRGGRGYYELKITVPPGRVFGAIDANSIVVIEVKGPNPQRIRIPIKGKGETN